MFLSSLVIGEGGGKPIELSSIPSFSSESLKIWQSDMNPNPPRSQQMNLYIVCMDQCQKDYTEVALVIVVQTPGIATCLPSRAPSVSLQNEPCMPSSAHFHLKSSPKLAIFHLQPFDKQSGAVFTNHSLERSLSYSPEFSMYRSI